MRFQQVFSGANPAGNAAFVDASPYEWVILTCTGLGATETLTIERHCGASGFVAASINDGTSVIPLTFTGSSGTPANRNQVKIDACGPLRVTGTAAAVNINVIFGPAVTPT
jgi:hypothetical protein